jgi:hypothetical protein
MLHAYKIITQTIVGGCDHINFPRRSFRFVVSDVEALPNSESVLSTNVGSLKLGRASLFAEPTFDLLI